MIGRAMNPNAQGLEKMQPVRSKSRFRPFGTPGWHSP
jgi:hypothetical protein